MTVKSYKSKHLDSSGVTIAWTCYATEEGANAAQRSAPEGMRGGVWPCDSIPGCSWTQRDGYDTPGVSKR